MTFRVIQWATGNVGRSSLRAIARNPELELVGVLVQNPEKVGVDAGELCGLDSLGVIATDDEEAVLSLEADCVLHMPLPSARIAADPDLDLRSLCRILMSGKNAITTVGYVYPRAYGPEVVDRLERACAAGGVSVHGTGVNPGWLGELLPLTLSGMSARIDRVHVLESTDFAFYPSREVIVEMMGMGSSPAAFEESSAVYRGWLGGLFRESVEMIADGLALPLDDVTMTAETSLAEKRFEIAAGVIEPGTVAGQRFAWAGVSGGEERIVLEAIYRAHGDVSPEWPEPGCAVNIEGRPNLRMNLDDSWISNGLVGTALHAVNAVSHVVRAEPGIRTFLDLPLITGRHTVGR
jgi:4-hydroxy-tetrahydrodipicolinate reductase